MEYTHVALKEQRLNCKQCAEREIKAQFCCDQKRYGLSITHAEMAGAGQRLQAAIAKDRQPKPMPYAVSVYLVLKATSHSSAGKVSELFLQHCFDDRAAGRG